MSKGVLFSLWAACLVAVSPFLLASTGPTEPMTPEEANALLESRSWGDEQKHPASESSPALKQRPGSPPSTKFQPAAKRLTSTPPSVHRPAKNAPPSSQGPLVRRHAASRPSETLQAPARNFFVEQFFLPPKLRRQYQTWETKGFVFVKTPHPTPDSRFSVVTDFAGNVLKTYDLVGLRDVHDMRRWIREGLETSTFEGVEIRRLPVATLENGEKKYLYWVGHRAYESADRARAEIALVQSLVEAEGGDFAAMVAQAARYSQIAEPEEKPPVELTPAQYEREERLMLKFLDHLDVGNEMFGPFQGTGLGESILWQSFGETTYRVTNLDKRNFSAQVGFWTNRLVFKGIKAPLSTIDPFIEATTALESNGKDFASHLDLSAGLEWRPFSRNPWLSNFRPWGIPLLEWIRNYRFYVQYLDRKNLKDEISGSRDYDLRYGVQIFYEWGMDLPPISEAPPDTFWEHLRQNLWGEYFGDYRFHTTNFSSEEDFDAWILNSSVILGFRLPGIPLPPNPINDELVLMPYLRFEHVNNTEFGFDFENRYFVASGVRWMPFRTYLYKENEWLSKVKIFAEYVGIGLVQHGKQDGEAPDAIRYDLRFGVNISQRRF